MASARGRSQSNWVSIARQNNNHKHRAVVCSRVKVGEAHLGNGLNNHTEIHVHFLNAALALCKSHRCVLGDKLVFYVSYSFSFYCYRGKKGQQMVTLDAHTERIRNNIHSFRERTFAAAPGGICHKHGFCPHPYWDVQLEHGQWKVIFDNSVSTY